LIVSLINPKKTIINRTALWGTQHDLA